MNRIPIKACLFLPVFTWFFVIAGPAHAEAVSESEAGTVSPSVGSGERGRPIVIAHRGASGLRPEHTLAAYELALVQGADFIELDLVATGDGALISRHENALAMVALDEAGAILRNGDGSPRIREATTDVADRPEFRDRLTVKQVDGRLIGGWFSEDFTLAEIRTLRARERMPQLRRSNRLYDNREGVPTLEDVVVLVRRWERETGQRPGLYIELKHPTYFRAEGVRLGGEPIRLDLAGLLLSGLETSRFTDPRRLFIQCFEVWPLMDLRRRMEAGAFRAPLIQLYGDVFNRRFRAAPRDLVYYTGRGEVARYGALARLLGLTEQAGSVDLTYQDLARPEVLAFMAEHYADGIGPPRSNVLSVQPADDGGAPRVTGAVETFFEHALQAGLLVHPYTLRAERPFLFSFEGRPLTIGDEARMLIRAGVDGFFIDQPSEGRLAVDVVPGGTF